MNEILYLLEKILPFYEKEVNNIICEEIDDNIKNLECLLDRKTMQQRKITAELLKNNEIKESLCSIKLDFLNLIDKSINRLKSNSEIYLGNAFDLEEMKEEKKYIYLKMLFLSKHMEFLDGCENDNVEYFFMCLNRFLKEILDYNSCIFLHNHNKKVLISWNISNEDLKALDYESFENMNRSDIDNRDSSIVSIKHSISETKKIEFFVFNCNQNDRETIEEKIKMYFQLTREFYLRYYKRLLNIDSNRYSQIGNHKFFLDATQFILKNNFSYNRKLNDEIPKEKLNILHISDCHIKSQNDCAFAQKFLNYMTYNFNKVYKYNNGMFQSCDDYPKKDSEENKVIFLEDKIDFIVVTGDIIQAGKSSKDILENYQEAYKQIRIIAQKFLGNIWRNRLLIIPGNHDYGMINELEIKLKDRSYESSSLVQSGMTEFNKFAFFHLIFDKTMFDADLSEQKKKIYPHKLTYKIKSNLQLSFYLFNTSANANFIRSNKVTLADFDEHLISTQIDLDEKNILLMHHTELNQINYYRDIFVSDKYKEYIQDEVILGCSRDHFEVISKIISPESTNSLRENMKKLKDIHTSCNKKLDERYFRRKQSIESLKIDNNYKIILISSLDNIVSEIRRYNNKLYNAFASNYNVGQNVDENDVLREDYYKLESYFKTSVDDDKRFKEKFQSWIAAFDSCIVLGGHQHCQSFKEKIEFKDRKSIPKYTILEAGKTIDESQGNRFKFNIISYMADIDKFEYYSSVPLSVKDKQMCIFTEVAEETKEALDDSYDDEAKE
ncbi:MAG: metallophosphoesterase [Anaeroplasmataceae bacterium]|nr:metallophosphoesterase [Anaeroplasmataceae bacterium]